MAHEHEDEAFQKFVDVFHGETTLLVDTYDVRAAIERLIHMRLQASWRAARQRRPRRGQYLGAQETR